MTSVREALDVVGQAVSIKELAHQRQASFPLSLREFVGALPPGRLRKKVIALDFLQRKFDELFNHRPRPLLQVRLDGNRPGQSTLSVLFDDPLSVTGYDEENPVTQQELAGPGEVLEFPGVLFGTHRYRFADVRSDGLTLVIVSRQPVGIEVGLHFESEGVEMRVEGFPNIDFEGFIIKLNMALSSHGGSLDLSFVHVVDSLVDSARVTFHNPEPGKHQAELTVSFRGKEFGARGPAQIREGKWQYEGVKNSLRNKLLKEFIYINVSVDVEGVPDGRVAEEIESTMAIKIYEALKKKDDDFKKVVTRWLLGGDSYVVGISSDDRTLSIDYLLPPGQLEPFPEEPQPPLDPGLLANIDHIVVLMMENRSFDHMLGYLSKHGGRAKVDGLRGGEKNRYKGRDYPSFPLTETAFNESPCHRHDCIEHQINGGQLDGFVADFAKHYESQGVDPGKVMGYYQAVHVDVYDALAKAFLICQRWFAAHPGPTFPNRFYTLTGRLNRDAFGLPENDNPHDDAFKPVFTRTIFDHLTEHGVSWRYYEHRYCFLRMFERYTFDDNYYIVDAGLDSANLVADIAAGRLPSVTFIDPNFIDEPDGQDNDDAPPADIARGQRLIGQVVNAVMNSHKWNKTLLVITYDEHGGFYDHVNPLLFSEKAKPVSGINYYGVRVPTFVISPWVDPDVSDVVFDHTSIAKTIIRRFMSANPPDMGERVAVANDLSMVLRSTARQDRPSIPVPPAPVRNAALARQAAPVEASDDFKELLRTMRSRYPVPRAISSSAPLR